MLFAGQVYQATITVRDLGAPPSLVVLTITKPDGTLVTPEIGPPEQAGRDYTYTYDYPLPTPGLFQFAWTTQGPGTAPRPEFVNVGSFLSIVSTAEVMAHLNKVKDTDYDELGRYMQAATELVEDKVGICVPRTFTSQVDEGSYQLIVPYRPVLSVQSVKSIWAGGPTWTDPGDGSVLAADTEAGLIYQPSMFPFWLGPWNIEYRCGRAEIAMRWQHAALEQIRHLWETQRGSMPPALLQGEEVFTATSGWTFSVPRRVLELLETDMVPSS